ncbi:DegV family protein [Deinococcus sedimenti]|uniref:DegV family protein n=1 Tax=Deinococcus sedimenti TaxID=1867090 RepID=A0ABQ2S0Q1_9DEIO|nr:DegV family protein [Deinococcus sedimenti]GGR85790.1 hypothetical protein GCM10008960_11160 [Deinococcus sedimenti]
MIAVLADSTCDLHPESAKQLGIHIIPLHVSMQQRTLLDWQEIDPDAVYDHMRAGGSASTSPVTVKAFMDIYLDLLTRYDAVISLHISGKLSDTVSHAQEAVRQLGQGARVHVIDTEYACAPLAELAMIAAARAAAGDEAHQVTRAVLDARNSMYGEFSVATLDYLRRSGRIGRAQAFVGGLLGVRPVLSFDRGELKAARRVKVDQAAGDMLDSLKQRFGNTPLSVAIMHAGRDVERINALRSAMVASGLNVQRGRVQLMGPVIGAHVGPGTFGFNALPLV